MFGIGAPELILILVVALLIFGPKRLPELARTLGRGMAEFRRTSNDLRRSLNEASDLARIDPPEPTPEPGGSGEIPGEDESLAQGGETGAPGAGETAPGDPGDEPGAGAPAPESERSRTGG